MNGVTSGPTARPRTDRFLVGILLGVVILLLAAGVAVFALRQPAPPLPAGSPGGVVQRFLLAVEDEDYDRAYDLLAGTMSDKPTRDEFVRYYLSRDGYYDVSEREAIRIAGEKIRGDEAFVTIAVTHFYSSGGPFSGSGDYTYNETFHLQREAGVWGIYVLPDRYAPPPRPVEIEKGDP